MKIHLFALTVLVILLAACSSSTQSGNPAWVDELIQQFESDPVGNPPLSIWRYEYDRQVVYFVPAHCCDIPSTVYDADGNVLCSPDGGLTGQGDGRCPDFFSNRSDEQLIWKDSRAPAAPTRPVIPSPSPAPTEVTSPSAAVTCTATIDDGLSPSYKPNAPVRSSVGHGHVLEGVVRSSLDCAPIANAKIELWPEYAGQGHTDEARATVFTDSAGRYRFECDPPEHIHMRISAEGYRTLAQNSYHPNGQAEGRFDIVLVPASP